MLNTLIALYLIYLFIKLTLAVLDMRFVRAESNKNAVVLEESEYKNAALIKVANHKFEIISSIFSFFVFLFWVNGGLKWLYNTIVKNDLISENIAFVMSFIIISAIFELPFGIYEKFVKDKKHGFSNMSAKIFIIDTLKELVLTLVFGSAFVWLILFCIQSLGQFWWFWAFCISFVIILIINLIYPTIIAPMFNKVKPLEDGELKTSIEGLLNGLGFKSSGVFVMDASKRDNRLNAYFGGLGATKRVVLFDTLIKKLSLDEIIAVLGHELGHFKHGDIFKMIAMSAVMMFLLFMIFGNIPSEFYEAVGLVQSGSGVIVFMLIFAPIFSLFFSPVISFISRRNEFGADEFGAKTKSKTDMINALKKLGSENKAFPKSHPLYAFVYHSHPSLFERITKLENDDK
ncbi:M48 family metallopeptidase [Campylobacter suis]|uniref:Protease HtpX n=1 Tax=Campylobacter suis TaxID=2790657 RepID=A0ABM8Q196_9BACT|nr:M48 family metallopeptidase [Campylobacter suis]CAD7286545.1 Protease HtpX [Campylobacter suis]